MFHFLSIDTEGGELDVLATFDFAPVFVHCVAVENNYYGRSLEILLLKKGFLRIANRRDEIYLNMRSRFFVFRPSFLFGCLKYLLMQGIRLSCRSVAKRIFARPF